MADSLKNKNILLCRTEEQAKEDVNYLESLGFTVNVFPTIKIVPIEVSDNSIFEEIYDFLVLTSTNSITHFLDKNYQKIRFNNLVCIGKKTAELCKKYGYENIIIPEVNSSDGLINLFSDFELTNKKILIPGSKISNPKFVNFLKSKGASVLFIPVYDTCLPFEDEIKANLKNIENIKIDVVVFSSPSTFENFLKIIKITNPLKYFENIKIAAIGDITKNRIEKEGINVDIIPAEFKMKSLADEIYKFYKTMPEKI